MWLEADRAGRLPRPVRRVLRRSSTRRWRWRWSPSRPTRSRGWLERQRAPAAAPADSRRGRRGTGVRQPLRARSATPSAARGRAAAWDRTSRTSPAGGRSRRARWPTPAATSLGWIANPQALKPGDADAAGAAGRPTELRGADHLPADAPASEPGSWPRPHRAVPAPSLHEQLAAHLGDAARACSASSARWITRRSASATSSPPSSSCCSAASRRRPCGRSSRGRTCTC